MNDTAARYQQLGALIATMPDLNTSAWCSPEGMQWLGRANALVQADLSDPVDHVRFKSALDRLGSTATYPDHVSVHADAVQKITMILYRALGRAELSAPASAQGSFIPVGESFTAVAALSKILGSTTTSALIVDPYADGNILTEFGLLSPEGIQLMILGDTAGHKAALKPTAEAWVKQYGSQRPLEVRVTPAGALHDRLIIVDRREVWTVGQSFNALAKRSPTSFVRVDADTAKLKVGAYDGIWAAAFSVP